MRLSENLKDSESTKSLANDLVAICDDVVDVPETT